jgi:hypothetical protein
VRPRAIMNSSSIGNGASTEQPKKWPHGNTPTVLSLRFCISQKVRPIPCLAGYFPPVGQLGGLSRP